MRSFQKCGENQKGSALKVQTWKLYNNKYLVASAEITNKIFAFIAVLVFKSLSRKVLFMNRKDNRNW